MSEKTATLAIASVVTLIFAMLFAALIVGDLNSTARYTACVEAGGTYLASSQGDCILDPNGDAK